MYIHTHTHTYIYMHFGWGFLCPASWQVTFGTCTYTVAYQEHSLYMKKEC